MDHGAVPAAPAAPPFIGAGGGVAGVFWDLLSHGTMLLAEGVAGFTLIVSSAPPGASIFLDGGDTGEITPAEFADVPLSTHNVTVVTEGYLPGIDAAVGGAAGETTTVHFDLTAEGGEDGEPTATPDPTVTLDPTITPDPTATALEPAFSANATTGAIPLAVAFTDESTGNVTGWLWNFGDGNTSVERHPVHTYTGAGRYTVSLTVAGTDGTATVVRDEYIDAVEEPAFGILGAPIPSLFGAPLLAPAADFTGVPTSGIAPLTVSFTDNSTGDPTGWAWFFGDETYDQAWTPVNGSAGWSARRYHTCVALPDRSLVLMGGLGGSGNDVWRSTDNGATWTEVNTSAGWSGRFSHSSVALPDGSIVLMGGSGGGSRNDTWRSADGGATWTEVNASAGWSRRYGHSSVALPDGSIVLMGGYDSVVGFSTYFNDVWRSTDGGETWTEVNTSAGWEPRKWHGSVVLPDGSLVLMGGMDSDLTPLNDTWRSTDGGETWTQLPNAGWSARQGHSSVALPDGSIVLMGGDGASGYRNDVWRSTDNGATWTEVNASAGWEARYGHTCVALPGGSIVLVGGSDETCFNDVWRLQPAGSTDRDPTHEYTTPGTYPVTLQAYNDDGCNSTRKVDYITVMALLGADFTGTPVSGPAPLTVSFTDASTGSPTAWNWSFGDGEWFNTTNAAEKNPTHIYTVAENYSVTLTVANATGETNLTRDDYITVTVPLEAGFTGTPTSGSAPLTVSFTDQTIGDPTGWAWFFGDETYGDAWANQTAAGGEPGWSGRCWQSSVVLRDGSIVLMGGMDVSGPLNDVWRSDDGGETWTEVNESAGWMPRVWHSSAALPDGSIVLMGGSTEFLGGETCFNDTWRSTDNGTTWTQLPDAGWPARGSHSSAALPDGSLVLMGGVDSDSAPLNDTWRSTDGGTTWTQLPNAGWSARAYHTSAAMRDGSIVLMGGMVGFFAPSNDVWRLPTAGSTAKNPTHLYDAPGIYSVALQAYNDGDCDSTREIDYVTVTEPVLPEANFTGAPTSGLAPLNVSFTDLSTGDPTGWTWFFGDETYGGAWTNQTAAGGEPGWLARASPSSVVLRDGSIVLMGGAGIDGNLNDTWCSIDNGTTWTEMNASAGWSARGSHTNVALPDGSIVLMGGVDNDSVKLNDTWRSTDNGATWALVNASSGWPGRQGHSSVVLPDGSIVLMGGADSDGNVLNDTWLSADGGATWALVNASAGWSARGDHSSVVLPDGSIVLMGGLGGPTYLNDTWRSTDGGATWTQLPNAGWEARFGHSSVALPDGSIVLMGGMNLTGDSDDSDENLLNDTWRSADGGETWTQLPDAGWTARIYHTCVALPDGSIVFMGGVDDSEEYVLNDVWRLQPAGSAEQHPTHEYTAPGTYSVALQAYNDDGYDSTHKVDYITVAEPLAANFTGTPTSGLAPLTVSFTDASTGSPTAWNWSFGDGAWFNTTDAAEKNPTHTYTAVRSYPVGLTVANAAGENNLTRDDYITVVVPPEADFSGAPTSGSAPLNVSFTDQSTGATGWTWFFGDETYGDAWTNQTAAGGEPGWSARAGHSSVALPGGSIVLMGGTESLGGETCFNDTWRSTDNGATWTRLPDAGWPARFSHSSVALPDRSIVLMGGIDKEGDIEVPFNDTWRSTDGGATWTEVNASAGWSARGGHTSVVLRDGSVVLMGGTGSDETSLNDTWRSTDNGSTWTEVNASAGWPARGGHTSAALPDGSIVLMGGMDGPTRFNDTWRSTDNGTTWALMNASAGWTVRLFPSSVALPDGSILLMGGMSFDGTPTPLNDTWRSTDNGATWALVNASAGWTARFFLSSVALPDGSIVLIGGQENAGPLNDVWRLQPAGSTDRNPKHEYTAPGTYAVTLQAYNPYGFNASTVSDYISVSLPPPVANFTFAPGEGNAPLTVQFNDTSAGNVTVWSWDFGDGNTSTDRNVTHTYTAADTYTVSLNASNLYGFNVSTVADAVLVLSSPVANFTFAPGEGNAPLAVQFNDTSAGNVTAWSWDFGDGNTSTAQNPVHTYAAAATYPVSLNASNAHGYNVSTVTDAVQVLPVLVADFTFAPNEGNAPLTVQFNDTSAGNITAWSWDFGDENTSTDRNATHTYASAGVYTVSLNASNVYGYNVSTVTDAVQVLSSPVAGFTYAPNGGNAPLEVRFNDTSAGNVTAWSWDFGDGNTSTDRNATHTYAVEGTYAVSLNASNAYGWNTWTVTDAVQVLSAPVAGFMFAPSEGNAPLEVQFNDTSAGNVTAWSWDFGDGNTSTLQHPAHIYAAAGTYTVSLNASNVYGYNVSTMTDAIQVLSAPVANFTFTPNAGNAPLTVQFTDTSAGNVTAWFWEFDDGTNSTLQHPEHTYAATGTYMVSLNASNVYGYNVSTMTGAVQVLAAPVANFTFAPNEGNTPLTVQFNDTSAGNVTAWSWDFGDGNTSIDRNATHTYAAAGNYTVSLNASNAYGYNVSEVADAVQVLSAPVADFILAPNEGNAPLEVQFNDTSGGNVTAWSWDFGDGNTSTDRNPVHTYAAVGTYSVSLNASNMYGYDVSTMTDAVQVLPAPVANFTFAPNEGNTPLTVQFNDTSAGNVTAWSWDFGDGNISTARNPVHIYAAAGTYSISLNASNAYGYNVSEVADAVQVLSAPVANFTFAPNEGNAPLTVQFNDTSAGSVTEWFWTFGDGNTSTDRNPVHAYTVAGVYPVSLNASNAYGWNTSIVTDAVRVLSAPVAGFTYAPNEGNAPLTVQFNDTSAGNVTAWSWDFGDGNTSTDRNPIHTYAVAGVFPVSLNASNAYRYNVSTVIDAVQVLPAPAADFTYTPNEGNAPLTVQFNDISAGNVTAWSWDFGDGNTSADRNPAHTYAAAGNYTVSLNASNAYGWNTSTVTGAVQVLAVPIADFAYAPNAGNTPLTVQFNDTSAGNVTRWVWDFGDGNTSTDRNPTHTYATAGTYPVSLNASNTYGYNSSTVTDAVQVFSGPVASFTYAPNEGNVPLTVQFNDTSAGNVTVWVWDFGDGNTSTDRNATHTYAVTGTYSVSLNASNTYGYNVSTVTGAVQVLSTPVANFTYAPNEGNVPLEVQFNDTSAGNVTGWSWDFGDGNTSAAQNPAHTYAAAGAYTVSLNASNAYGYNVSTVIDAVQVLPAPVAGFTFAPSEGNAPLTVQFNDTSAGNVTAWSWSFGDGNTSTDRNPVHTYAAAGTYTVSLNASNAYGYNVSTVTDAVQVISAPVADFTFAPSEGNAPLTVQFNDTSAGNVTGWAWDFGDGNTSAAQNPVHTYAAAGTYSVSLNASNAYGYNVSTVIDAIQVLSGPVADFTYAPNEGNAPLTVQFNDTSAGNVTAWSWDFGDGNISTVQNPVHTYVAAGTYSVSLNASNAYGYNVSEVADAVQVLSGPVAGFTYAPNEGNAPLTVQFNDTSVGNVTGWTWDFGDGNTSTDRNPVHSYVVAGTYTVSLNASNTYGYNVSTATDAVQVLSGPVAGFIYAPSEGNAPLTVQFNDTSLGDVTVWVWDFGDGNTSTDRNATHTYTAAGMYSVSLNASNAYGYNVSTVTEAVRVLSGPVADFTFAPNAGNAPLAVQFNDTSIGNVTAWYWSFGDGNTSAEQSPVHTYAESGAYTVSLNASNAYGSSVSTVTDAVVIFAPLVSRFTFSPEVGNAPLTVQFNDTSAGNVTAWSWDFGDGNTSTAQNPVHTYVSAGVYTVSLNASNAYGFNASTVTEAVRVLSAPVASFTHTPNAGNAPLTVQFNDTSTGNVTAWLWDFGDGATSAEQNPVHTYSKAGTYTVTLTVENDYGSDSETKTDSIVVREPAPAIDFAADNTSGTAPLTVTFTAASTGGKVDTWLWDFGDNATSVEQNPVHTYTAAGTYTVNLTVTNDGGSDTEVKTNYITVTEPEPGPDAPVANFTANITSGVAPLAVQFADTSENTPTSWLWDFGDNATSAEQHPVHTYTAAGTYTVNLRATNGAGSDTEVKTSYITVTEPGSDAPVANFIANITSGKIPLAVQFNDTSTGSPTAWAWDFNSDGTIDSTEQNPVHTYTAAGVYTVNLTATNDAGSDFEVKTDYITVTEPEPGNIEVASTPAGAAIWLDEEDTGQRTNATLADVSVGRHVVTLKLDGYADASKEVTVVSGETATVDLTLTTLTGSLEVTSTPPGAAIFIDGAGTGTTTDVTLDGIAVGTHTVTVTKEGYADASAEVIIVDGETATVHFNLVQNTGNIAVTSIPEGAAISLDGTDTGIVTNDTLSGVPIGNHTVAVTLDGYHPASSQVTVSSGLTASVHFDLVPSTLPPVANFTANVTSGAAPLTVQFTDTSTGATAWAWDFGDGNTSAEQHPVHVYDAIGVYTVTLTVTNDAGSDSEVRTNCITVTGPDAPVADFTGTPVTGDAPLEVRFTDSSTGKPVRWTWEFGDGRVATTKNPITTYRQPGTYTVNLTVSNDFGSDSKVKTSYITVTRPDPVASFTADRTGGNADLTVQFTDTSSGSPTSWSWDFGDGATSADRNPAHVYTAAGTYTVTLEVRRDGGPASAAAEQIVVRPVAGFTADTTRGYAPVAVQFTDTSTGSPTSWSWDFGDGTTSADRNPAHVYTATGTYTVTLTVTGGGQAHTEAKAAYITAVDPGAPPAAEFRADATEGYAPLIVRFFDQSQGDVDEWLWNFGDGSMSSDQNPEHTYTAAGTYTVTLTVKKAGVQDNTRTKTAYVTVDDPKPVADFTATRLRGEAPLTVQFTDTSTGAPPLTRAWNFGDGTNSNLRNPTHVFDHDGEGARTYTVTLTVTNSGGSGVKTTAITVVAPPQKEDVGDRVDRTNATAIEDIPLTYQELTLEIPKGHEAKQADGSPITEFSVGVAPDLEEPPAGTIEIGGKAFKLGPEGAKFNPKIPVTITFTRDEWENLFGDGKTTKLQRYDGKNWVELENQTRDDATFTITGYTDSFSVFAPVTTTISPEPTTTPGSSGGGGGSASPTTSTGTADLLTSSSGAVLRPYIAHVDGNFAHLFLKTGVTALDGAGNPLSAIGIAPVSTLPGASSLTFSGYAVDCTPAGATFSPAIDLVFTLTGDEWAAVLGKAGGNPVRLVVQGYDAATGAWTACPTSVDAAAGTVTASVSHFSTYALFIEEPAEPPVTTGTATVPAAAATTAPSLPTETGEVPLGWIGLAVLIVAALAVGYVVWKKR